ncbi:hypothetical protein CASFOL_002236 [Castilleja foliolosa]|uniref:Metallothionein n=1 Tax=Castilleja foliolosa TaxID=1961234 RepID=A0ABD3EHE7_9LAMI
MSNTCGSCDCSDKSQCVKKGYTAEIVETEKRETMVMDVPAAAENDCKCKCGTSCACTNCTCAH